MNDWLLAVLIGVVIGLLLGVKTSRDAGKKLPVKGGIVAQVFHYLACSGFTSVAPFALTGVILGLPFLTLLGTGVGLLALTFGFLLVDAAIERAAQRTPSAA